MAAPVELRPEKKIGTFLDGVGNYCALTDSGTYGVVTSSCGDALAIDCSKEEAAQCHVYREHKTSAQQCTISVFGRVAATASLDGTVQVWNTEKPSQVWKKLTYKDYDRALGVALSRDGNTLAACYQKRDSQAGVIVLYRMPEFERITWWKTKKLDVYSGSIAISDDGAIVGHCSKVRAYAVQVQAAKDYGVNNPRSHKKWNVSGESNIAMSGDGCTMVVADEKTLRVIGLASNEEKYLEGYQRSFRAFCTISASGNRVVAAVAGNKFRIWDTESGRIVADIGGFDKHTRGCAINQDGNILLSCTFDRHIYITNILRAIENAKNPKGVAVPNAEKDTKEEESGLRSMRSSLALDVVPDMGHSMDKMSKISSVPEEITTTEKASSRSVRELISQLEDMAKQSEAEKNFDRRIRNSPEQIPSREENKIEDDEVETQEVESTLDDRSPIIVEEKTDASNASTKDPRQIFSQALERTSRKEEGNLLHLQASEALDEIFDESDLKKLDKYQKDDLLLSVDTDHQWRINERQFVEAAIKVMKAIRASKTDTWVAAYIGAAEKIENKITIPQAASLIMAVADENMDKKTLMTTLEEYSENNFEIDYNSFLSAVQKLGFED